jgi:hypothetical protein
MKAKSVHVIHLAGDLAGKGHLTQCGIREVEGGVHIVGPYKVKYVNCKNCLEWYRDMRLRLTATAFMRQGMK